MRTAFTEDPDRLARFERRPSAGPDLPLLRGARHASHRGRTERFLLELFSGTTELVDYVQRVLGYACTGETSEHAWWLLYGSGSNGKGTLIKTVHRVLGSYAHKTPFTTFLHSYRGGGISNDLAALAGYRFVWASEVNENARLNEGRIKSLTGDEAVSARFLNREFFTFEPRLKLFMAVNHRPQVTDDSYGMWRRVRVVPFEQRFPINKGLDMELAAEAEGIFAWLVRGCLLWLSEGLNDPEGVRMATKDYEAESDRLADFLETTCTVGDGAQIGANTFYKHYVTWADASGLTKHDRLTQTMFGRKVSQRFNSKKTASGKVYFGVSRRTHDGLGSSNDAFPENFKSP